MIPIGPILIGLYAASRSGRGAPAAKPTEVPPGVVVWLFFFWIPMLAVPLTLEGSLWGPVLLVVSAFIHFPWPSARLLSRLGLARAANQVASAATFFMAGDQPGGRLLAASLAQLHWGRRGAKDVAWFERKAAKVTPLRGAGLVAQGLHAWNLGDRDGARALLRLVLELHPKTCPRAACWLAARWLAADAAERGRWDELATYAIPAALPQHGRWFWRLLARAFDAEAPRPGRVALHAAWLLAGMWWRTRPMLRRALAPRTEPPAPAPLDEDPLHDDPLQAALALHAQALARPAGTLRRGDLARLAGAWDAALEAPSTGRGFAVRGLALEAPDIDRALPALRAQAASDLAALAAEAGIPLEGVEGATALSALHLLRERLAEPVEQAAQRLEERCKVPGDLDPADEVRECLALRARYEEAARLGGRGLRRGLYAPVTTALCSAAVRLWNFRHERAVANALFEWLLAEAVAQGAADDVALHRKNVACGWK
jgi:hypothetical protein